MSEEPPQSISTKVEAPESRARSITQWVLSSYPLPKHMPNPKSRPSHDTDKTPSSTSSTTPRTSFPSRGSLILPSHDISTSMLMLWAHGTTNVPVNERLAGYAVYAACNKNRGGGGGCGK